MIKDINPPPVTHVTLAVVCEQNEIMKDEWKVYMINNNDVDLENTLVASTGYGEKDGEPQRTSTLRHFLETVKARSSVMIEPIDPGVFHLNNEYWVSYYIGRQVFDKRFVFVPDSLCKENLTFIKELEREGVLHS